MIPSPLAREIPTGLGALGTDYRIDCSGGSDTGKTIDCDSWGNFFNKTCWGICSADKLAPGGTAPTDEGGGNPPPPAPTGICSVIPSLCDATGKVSTVVWIGIGSALVFGAYLLTRKR